MAQKRNAPCPCGSGRKFKKCCLGREAREAEEWRKASERDMQLMAKAKGITVEELREQFREAARPKITPEGAAAVSALFGYLK